MKQIPNIFTLLNLFLGCIAIVLTLQTDSIYIFQNDEYLSSFNIPEQMALASFFIFAAGLVDFLDGFVARLFKASSEMGKQLDSLADVVSFGVAPGAILYQLLRMSWMREEDGLTVPVMLLLPAFLLSCTGAYRLARFNIDTSQSYGFKGVPIPAAGILVASFPLILHYSSGTAAINALFVNKWVLYGIILVLSGLMVSTLPMMALKFKDYSLKNNLPKLILLGAALVTAIFFKWLAVPVVFVLYIILSLLLNKKES